MIRNSKNNNIIIFRSVPTPIQTLGKSIKFSTKHSDKMHGQRV